MNLEWKSCSFRATPPIPVCAFSTPFKAHELDITRAAFCGGESPYRYIQAFHCDLFLSTYADDVRQALAQDIAAATLLGRTRPPKESDDGLLKLAFDGDSVLFSDEAERVYQQQGLEAFSESELDQANQSLAGGPFKGFLAAMHRLQQEFPDGESPIRTALVTARGAPAHERVIRTLREWDIRLDESLFLGGMDKTEFLRAFEADIFLTIKRRIATVLRPISPRAMCLMAWSIPQN